MADFRVAKILSPLTISQKLTVADLRIYSTQSLTGFKKKKAKEGGNQMNHVIGCGNTLDLIKQVQPNSIDLLVTSPPY